MTRPTQRAEHGTRHPSDAPPYSTVTPRTGPLLLLLPSCTQVLCCYYSYHVRRSSTASSISRSSSPPGVATPSASSWATAGGTRCPSASVRGTCRSNATHLSTSCHVTVASAHRVLLTSRARSRRVAGGHVNVRQALLARNGTREPMFKLLVVALLANGSSTVISTSTPQRGWRAGGSPTTRNNIYLGEKASVPRLELGSASRQPLRRLDLRERTAILRGAVVRT